MTTLKQTHSAKCTVNKAPDGFGLPRKTSHFVQRILNRIRLGKVELNVPAHDNIATQAHAIHDYNLPNLEGSGYQLAAKKMWWLP